MAPPPEDTLHDTFLLYSRHGCPQDSITMTGKNFTKLCKDTGIIDGRTVTTTDIDIEFSKKVKKGMKMDYRQFKDVIFCVAQIKNKDPDKLFNRVAGAQPNLQGVTGTSRTGNVEKMTDTSLYTGSHKERFDREGKGKGLDGRKDCTVYTGYVSEYRDEGTFDKKLESTGSGFHPGVVRHQSHGGASGSAGALLAAENKRTTKSSTAADVTSRLTDTSKYTGAHKQRFDSSGRGKGIAGRADIASDHSGYVGNYRGAGTYDSTH